ncbi:hypothetical protein [Nonomuraea basaltis]|uniref:hypothetical protein n=1 Tax=Nonomuraea basaltis TaxID=2495887 RepID=UPI00110C66D8|nr:hypothetical protein [Nonomuraea basaltis]TMR92854.1 hypothetical protein EJK15_42630 [Nonomuraea basaltis]
MNRNDNSSLWGCGILVLGGLILLVVALIKLSTARVETITVKDKERVCDSSNSCRYLVWDRDGDVYENTDAWLSLKFDSSTLYGQLEEGHTYHVKVNGWRVPATSSYPNILSIEGEVTK